MYIVKFECDLLGNHQSPTIELCDIDTIRFVNKIEAIKFIQECTSAITKTTDICPELIEYNDIFKEPPLREIFMHNIKNIHLVLNNEDFKELV